MMITMAVPSTALIGDRSAFGHDENDGQADDDDDNDVCHRLKICVRVRENHDKQQTPTSSEYVGDVRNEIGDAETKLRFSN